MSLAVSKCSTLQINLNARVMVASIAFKFNFEGSVVLDYTTLNVEAL
jgi:hypothetical protein